MEEFQPVIYNNLAILQAPHLNGIPRPNSKAMSSVFSIKPKVGGRGRMMFQKADITAKMIFLLEELSYNSKDLAIINIQLLSYTKINKVS